jgi:hypothetical protein
MLVRLLFSGLRADTEIANGSVAPPELHRRIEGGPTVLLVPYHREWYGYIGDRAAPIRSVGATDLLPGCCSTVAVHDIHSR